MGVLPEKAPRTRAWAPTRWSVVGTLDDALAPEREASWRYLVGAYAGAMEGYLRRLMGRLRGRPCAEEEASAIAQDFLGVCVEKGWLSRADPTAGPFRAFLQVLLRRYAYRRIKHERAQRRRPAGEARVHSLYDDEAIGDVSDADRQELDAFDRTWAEVAVERARKRLAEEHERYLVVIDDLIHTSGEGSADLAERVGVRKAQLPVLRHRARHRFAQVFEEELYATVGDEQQFKDEWQVLRPYLP